MVRGEQAAADGDVNPITCDMIELHGACGGGVAGLDHGLSHGPGVEPVENERHGGRRLFRPLAGQDDAILGPQHQGSGRRAVGQRERYGAVPAVMSASVDGQFNGARGTSSGQGSSSKRRR